MPRRLDVLTSLPTRPAVRKGRKPPPEGENARGRFLRIGQPRVVNAVRALRLIGNLARGDYDWNAADIQRMRATLQTELDRLLNEFEQSNADSKKHVDFHFDTSELEEVLNGKH